MARIAEFREVQVGKNQVHEAVECGYRVFSVHGDRYLQLDTYGTEHRAQPGKVSQSIQLDEGAAEELLRLIAQAFPRLERDLP